MSNDGRLSSPGACGRPGTSSSRPLLSCCSGFLLAGVLAVLVPEKALSSCSAPARSSPCCGRPRSARRCPCVRAVWCRPRWALRRQGATPGATAAFLIATPETGVDSISLSYALMDPIMTVFRPIAAGDDRRHRRHLDQPLRRTQEASAEQQTEAQPAVGEVEPHAAGAGTTRLTRMSTAILTITHDGRTTVRRVGIRHTVSRPVRHAAHCGQVIPLRVSSVAGRYELLGRAGDRLVRASSRPPCRPAFFEQYLSSELGVHARDAGSSASRSTSAPRRPHRWPPRW